MNVTCPECRTIYRVDPAKVPAQGVIALCARCPAEFAVQSAAEADIPGTSAEALGQGITPESSESAGAAAADAPGWGPSYESESSRDDAVASGVGEATSSDSGWEISSASESGEYADGEATGITESYQTDHAEAYSAEDGDFGQTGFDHGSGEDRESEERDHGYGYREAGELDGSAQPSHAIADDPTHYGSVELDSVAPDLPDGSWGAGGHSSEAIELADDEISEDSGYGAPQGEAEGAEQEVGEPSAEHWREEETEDRRADSPYQESTPTEVSAEGEQGDYGEEPVAVAEAAAEPTERADLRETEEEALRAGFSASPVSRSDVPDLPPAPFGSADPHARARRLARALVSDIVVYHPDRRERSLREGSLRQEFREEIRKSWDEYVAHVGDDLARETPYFRDALNDLLAGGSRLF